MGLILGVEQRTYVIARGRFNLHIPWSNESVYWDYGNTTGTGYGRLKTSITANGTSFDRDNYYIYEFSYNDDTTVMTNNKNAVELGQYVSNVTNVADINGKSGYTFNLGHDDYISNASFEGDIAEILIFSKDLTPAESAKINAYLAAKWGLSANLDSDNDGFTDAVEIAAGSNPSDATSLAITYPDFSDAVDAEIGSASGLDNALKELGLMVGCR